MRTFIINSLLSMGIVRHFFELNPAVEVNASNAFLAFVVVYFLLWLLSYFYNTAHFRKMPKVVSLFFFFIKELLKANFRIAYDVVTPKHHMVPGVVAYPLEAKTNLEITMLASLISLTPGSLSIDVSEDRKTLYIHSMYTTGDDMEQIKTDISNGFEKRILEITR
jgi:multicomponent Na+:H+ antiporter subunit E